MPPAQGIQPRRMPWLLAADLDLMQACRHAGVLAGHPARRRACGGVEGAGPRGLPLCVASLRLTAGMRGPEFTMRGRAHAVDCGLDLPATASLAELCAHTLVSTGGACTAAEEAPTTSWPQSGRLSGPSSSPWPPPRSRPLHLGRRPACRCDHGHRRVGLLPAWVPTGRREWVARPR